MAEGAKMLKARIYALLSAIMSLTYLACFPATLIVLFYNWRIAVFMIPFGFAAAFLAKWFNGLKLREMYGREVGKKLNDLDWASGRRIDPWIFFQTSSIAQLCYGFRLWDSFYFLLGPPFDKFWITIKSAKSTGGANGTLFKSITYTINIVVT